MIIGPNLAYAQEDETVDDMVDVDNEEVNVTTEDELEEEAQTASADADTTILFTKPVVSSLSSLGEYFNIYYCIDDNPIGNDNYNVEFIIFTYVFNEI